MSPRIPFAILDAYTPFEVWRDLHVLEKTTSWPNKQVPGWTQEILDEYGFGSIVAAEKWAKDWLIAQFIEDPHNLEPIRAYLEHVEEMASDFKE